jgi:serine/threonine protein kinase
MNTGIESHSDELQYGTKLDNYIIQSVLGRGAFGITYLAIDNLDRKVAIKEYLPSGFSKRDKRHTVSPLTEDNQALFKYGLDCFLDEAKTVGKFNHPNIVRVLAFFKANQTAYMVMEYEVGQDLKAYLKQYPKLSEQRLLEIFCPINDGLINVHENGYIHRDIKPANIYIRKDNSPVLLDFGAARDVFNAKIDQLTRILTPGYAPYEQDNPSWADQGSWTDIYALGATLYFAMKNSRIVASQERASAIMLKTDDPYQSLASQLHGRYSAHFLAAIDHALAFHPDQRPQSVSDWNTELLGSSRSDEDKTAILLTGKFPNNLDDTTLIAPKNQSQPSNTITSATIIATATTPQAGNLARQNPVKNSINIDAIEAIDPSDTAQSDTVKSNNTSTLQLLPKLLAIITLASIVILIIYLYYIDNNKTKSTLSNNTKIANIQDINTVPAPKSDRLDVKNQGGFQNNPSSNLTVTQEEETATKAPAEIDIAAQNELISSKVEISLAHIISASEFYMRATIKQKAIADFEKDDIKISSKMLTTLKLQHSDFMDKFKYHFDIYSKNLLNLRNYNIKNVEKIIKNSMNNGEHANKPIHVHLGEFFISNINENSINETTIEKNLKDTLHNTVQ